MAIHNKMVYAQYTPPTPTRRNCFVASRRRCEHNSQLAHDDCRQIRSTIIFGNWPNRLHSCLTTSILIDVDNFFNNDDTMTSSLKKLSTSIRCGVGLIKRYEVCSVSKLSTESADSRRQLVVNCVHTADATQQNSFVTSASAVCIGH